MDKLEYMDLLKNLLAYDQVVRISYQNINIVLDKKTIKVRE